MTAGWLSKPCRSTRTGAPRTIAPMSDTPHLLVPWAAASSTGARQAWEGLQLPHLEKLINRLTPLPPDTQDEDSFSPPHERALGRALGLSDADGQIAFAARAAQREELAQQPGAGWAFVTPCHWQVRTDHVTLSDPATLQLTDDESRAYLALLAPWFAEDGITLVYEQPTCWLAHGAPLVGLSTASLDRVLHRDVRSWLPEDAAAAPIRRLHSEMQMLLYTHAMNDAREARGAAPVNAFWMHGTGALPEHLSTDLEPQVVNALRASALQEDWATWSEAWQALDAGVVAQLAARAAAGDAVQITLCGELAALSWHSAPRSLGARISSLFRPQRLSHMGKKL